MAAAPDDAARATRTSSDYTRLFIMVKRRAFSRLLP
jgi:hypothetical protein